MNSNIYEHENYKTYLQAIIESSPNGPRGRRKALAEAIGCQVSHVTNVLSGSAHFSSEQIEAAARFFGLSHQETECLLLLTQYNRAATSTLREFYSKLLQDKKRQHSNLKVRLAMTDELKTDQESRYYSSWHYAAVHILLTVPSVNTREAVASKLDLPLSKVDEVLSFLSETGLIRKVGVHFEVIRPTIHLEKNSPLISKHHINWRLKTILELDQADENQIHYSSVVSLSEEDYLTIKEIFSKTLASTMDKVKRSPAEIAAVISVDVYPL
jgi:uncharacterized protein (TIGR02147 family)